MTAKEYLKQISVLNEKIKTNLKHIDDLREKATSVGLSSSMGDERVQSSGSSNDKIGDIVSKIDEFEQITNETVDEYIDKKDEAMDLINQLDNAIYIEILTMRYFEQLSFEEIAVTINISYRHTTRLHGYALQGFQKIMDGNSNLN